MTTAIVSVGIGASYPKGVARLVESLKTIGYAGTIKTWTTEYPANSPTHQQVPYAFKLFAMREVANHDVVFWLDASMWAIRDLTPIFNHAMIHGAAVWRAGFSVADWCDPAPMAKLGLNREGAKAIPLVCGGIVAIATKHENGKSLLDQWYGYATDGVSFIGPWATHRHDMPSLSTLVYRLGIEPINCPKWFAYDYDNVTPKEETIVLARGMA